jgi:hypothetical protein
MNPWQKFVETIDLVLRDPAEHIGEPGLRVDAVRRGGLDEGLDDRRGLAAALRAHGPDPIFDPAFMRLFRLG